MEYIYITNDLEIATHVQASGVERVMIDLEILGKKERQSNKDTLISNHTLEDIGKMRRVLNASKLQVRINPINSNTFSEISSVISLGADIIMLPMFKTPDEVEKFISFVGGKVNTCLLLETHEAVENIDEILSVKGVEEIYIGLNDLHLGMNLTFMFELVSSGLVERLSEKIKGSNIRFGFGGIARFGQGAIDPKLILSEHVRIGSKIVILSRNFHGNKKNIKDLKSIMELPEEVKKIKSYYKYLIGLNETTLKQNKNKLDKEILDYVNLYKLHNS